MDDGTGPNIWIAWAVIIIVFGVLLLLAPAIRNRPHGEWCEDCHLPVITPKVWDREQYRCRECGTRYRIVTDMWRPRSEYRRWVPVNREDDDAPGRR